MSLLCGTSCGTPANAPSRFDDCAQDVLREFGANHFVLQTCDSAWTDILDTTEWATKIAANDLAISPAGILTINAPTQEQFELEGCGREAIGKLTYTVDFVTYQTEDDHADWTYFHTLFQSSRSWRIMFVDCNQVWMTDADWAAAVIAAGGVGPVTIAGETPGFEFSVIQAPRWEAGESDYGRWAMQFQIEIRDIIGHCNIPGAYAEF